MQSIIEWFAFQHQPFSPCGIIFSEITDSSSPVQNFHWNASHHTCASEIRVGGFLVLKYITRPPFFFSPWDS
jgi:hypothetical protein